MRTKNTIRHQKANVARSQMKNLMDRVDISIDEGATKNVSENEQILPFIVDAAILCVKQQLALRGLGTIKLTFLETLFKIRAILLQLFVFLPKKMNICSDI